MSPNLRTVIFDLDGTLTAPGQIDFLGLRRDIGCPASSDILTFVEARSRANPQEGEALMAIVHRYEAEALATVAPMPGLFSTLEALAELRLPLGVLTRNSRQVLKATLERLGITAYFQGLIAREDEPEGVLVAGRLELLLG